MRRAACLARNLAAQPHVFPHIRQAADLLSWPPCRRPCSNAVALNASHFQQAAGGGGRLLPLLPHAVMGTCLRFPLEQCGRKLGPCRGEELQQGAVRRPGCPALARGEPVCEAG